MENFKYTEADNKHEDNNVELPKISILEDEESKSLIPYIEKIKNKEKIAIPIGFNKKDIIIENINTMPNLLISGTVMSGKTSYINTIIASILLTKKPDETKLIIFDSKKIDYGIYNGVPHLMVPVIYDIKRLNIVLRKISAEIEKRINLLSETNIKSIDTYNRIVEHKYPDIVVIIDDYSSLNSMDIIDDSIQYITANGWSVNVYLILSSNHPSSKVISTISKANFPARLSFKVTSSRDSQIILDSVGAEKLSGLGMALYTSRLNETLLKIKVPTVSDGDIQKLVDFTISQQKAVYDENFMKINNEEKTVIGKDDIDNDDPLYNEIVKFVITSKKASASLLQRRFKLGYNRATRIIDLLEERGIIGPANDSKPRDILVSMEKENINSCNLNEKEEAKKNETLQNTSIISVFKDSLELKKIIKWLLIIVIVIIFLISIY